MFQLAVYGKGGIGKSTLSANVSVSLAMRGYSVMQLGCDPKHDSTRLLLDGRSQRTVLEYVREVPYGRRRLDDVLEAGTAGVMCAEAGGPEPGIGCAGRGILTTFDTLSDLGLDDIDHDFRIYDVLGDVVCGGFAVPLRKEYADAVIIVTSGEFMSMYAANNIMKGMSNFGTDRPRLLGIVLNSRGLEGEVESVTAFARAAGTDVIAVIPRDGSFASAESQGHTLREVFPDSEISGRIDSIVDRIVSVRNGEMCAVTPTPLDDDQLSDLVAGRPIRAHSGVPQVRLGSGCDHCHDGKRTTIRGTRVMSSCAAYGAMSAYSRMNDVAVVLHGPRSCMYIMDTTRAKVMLEYHARGLYDTVPHHNTFCTMMDDTTSIFGGSRLLEDTLRSVASKGYSKVAIITTCMPGIIGDDCKGVVDSMSIEFPDVRFDLIRTDGDVTGDFSDGFDIAVDRILYMVDPSVEPDPGFINLVGGSFLDLSIKKYSDELERVLSRFGLKVNMRFLDECSSDSIRMLRRGAMDMIVSDTSTNRELEDRIANKLGREPSRVTIPFGLYDYEEWVMSLGSLTGMEETARHMVYEAEEEYRSFVEMHRSRLAGRRVMLIGNMVSNFDWIIDLLRDVGADLVRVAFISGGRKRRTEPVTRYPDLVVRDYTLDDLGRDIGELRPHLFIGDLPRPTVDGCRFARMTKMGFGVKASMAYIRYLENMLRLPDDEGWKGGRKV